MNKSLILIFCLLTFCCSSLFAVEFSTAGFYELPASGREVYNMNPAWKFDKVDVKGAEGLMDGKVVANFKRIPSRRLEKIQLRVNNSGYLLQADGSDIVVVAELVDANGVVKRLSNGSIRFSTSKRANDIRCSPIKSEL